MSIFRILKHKYFMLLLPAIIITFVDVYTLYKSKENTPAHQYKQSVLYTFHKYIKRIKQDREDYRQEYFFYLLSKTSLTAFYTAIKHSIPVSYETYMASNTHGGNTSESLVFILPCIKEKFQFYNPTKHLFCLDKKIIFQLNENDNKMLYEIVTRLKSS